MYIYINILSYYVILYYISYIIFYNISYIYVYIRAYNIYIYDMVKTMSQTIPQITINRWYGYHSQSWVVYDTVSTTLYTIYILLVVWEGLSHILWKIKKCSKPPTRLKSVGIMTFPTEWKVIKVMLYTIYHVILYYISYITFYNISYIYINK